MALLILLTFVLSLGFCFIATEKKDWISAFCFLVFTSIALIEVVVFSETPTAMDVYQGKTTLEITYKDGVAIDSVVVFKK